MLIKFKPKKLGFVTKKGLSKKINPRISEEIGEMLKDTPEGDVIQPSIDRPVKKNNIDQGLYKGFNYCIFEGEQHNFKGFATRTIFHRITDKRFNVSIETSIRKTQHEAGKELCWRIDMTIKGYKYKYKI